MLGSGMNTVEVPVVSPFSIFRTLFTGALGMPRSYRWCQTAPLRRTETSSHLDSAFTADTPTP